MGGILRFSFPDTAGADLLALVGEPKLTAEVGKLVADDVADVVPFLASDSARWVIWRHHRGGRRLETLTPASGSRSTTSVRE